MSGSGAGSSSFQQKASSTFSSSYSQSGQTNYNQNGMTGSTSNYGQSGTGTVYQTSAYQQGQPQNLTLTSSNQTKTGSGSSYTYQTKKYWAWFIPNYQLINTLFHSIKLITYLLTIYILIISYSYKPSTQILKLDCKILPGKQIIHRSTKYISQLHRKIPKGFIFTLLFYLWFWLFLCVPWDNKHLLIDLSSHIVITFSFCLNYFFNLIQFIFQNLKLFIEREFYWSFFHYFIFYLINLAFWYIKFTRNFWFTSLYTLFAFFNW